MAENDRNPQLPPLRGRGSSTNPANRFDPVEIVLDRDAYESARKEEPVPGPGTMNPATRVFADASRSIISTNRSPDVGFEASLNPYRGCEHGCVYCYARPTHEYFGLSAGLDFETKLFAKRDASRLLRTQLESPSWKPRILALSGVTDPYQPVERKLGITRSCLEVLADFRNPVSIITKNSLVTRDLDLLTRLAEAGAVRVTLSITTLDEDLRRRMEPRTTTAAERLRAVEELSRAGIPVGVMAGPVVPGLTDHELPAILAAAAGAGAENASYIVLRLPHGVAALFEDWLAAHYPDRKKKILNRIRALRGGRLNDPRFGSRMRGEGVFAEEIRALYELGLRKSGLAHEGTPLSTRGFRVPSRGQLPLFDPPTP